MAPDDPQLLDALQSALHHAAAALPSFVRVAVCLNLLPASRSTLRTHGIVACALALSLADGAAKEPAPAPLALWWMRIVLHSALAAVSGLSLALPLMAFSEAIGMLGRFIDNTRGSQQAEQLLPGLEVRTSHLEGLGMFLGAALFLHSPARFFLCAGLRSSALTFPSTEGCAAAMALSLQWTLQSAAPVAVPLLLFDAGIAILARLTPRASFAAELYGLRNVSALALLLLLAAGAAEGALAFAAPLGAFTLASETGSDR